MSLLIDLKGQVFGKWTVLERAENDKQQKVHWLCRCGCGREGVVQSGNLRSAQSKSCRACIKDARAIDMKGQTVGRWHVIERAENKGNTAYWLCRCSGCGREKEVSGANLRKGESRSCLSCAKTKRVSTSPIRAARLKVRMTMREFADSTGISQSAIAVCEKENRFFSDTSHGPKSKVKFNKFCRDMRQSTHFYVGGGKKRVQNYRVMVKGCAYCGHLVNLRWCEAKRRSPDKPEQANAFCSATHAALYRHHGPLKPAAPTPTPQYIGNKYERVKEKRDLWAGANRVLEANRNKSKEVGT